MAINPDFSKSGMNVECFFFPLISPNQGLMIQISFRVSAVSLVVVLPTANCSLNRSLRRTTADDLAKSESRFDRYSEDDWEQDAEGNIWN